VAIFVLEAAKTALDLLDDFLAPGRIDARPDAGARAGRVLVLNDDARVDRVDAPFCDRKLVLPVQLNVGQLLDEGELVFDPNSDFLFLVGQFGDLLHLVGELDRSTCDRLVKGLSGRHGGLPVLAR
jgi:hypothetical protein